jgi:hypothetical protein
MCGRRPVDIPFRVVRHGCVVCHGCMPHLRCCGCLSRYTLRATGATAPPDSKAKAAGLCVRWPIRSILVSRAVPCRATVSEPAAPLDLDGPVPSVPRCGSAAVQCIPCGPLTCRTLTPTTTASSTVMSALALKRYSARHSCRMTAGGARSGKQRKGGSARGAGQGTAEHRSAVAQQ